MTDERCFNCGVIGHPTSSCTIYGPRFMEPGKTIEDYKELADSISTMVAVDILVNHSPQEVPEDPPVAGGE